MAAHLAKVFHVRLKLQEGATNGPHPFAAFNKDAGTPRVVRDEKTSADEPGPAPAFATSQLPPSPVGLRRTSREGTPEPPRAKTADDSSVLVLRDDQMAGEDRGSEPPRQTDSGLSEWAAKPRKRQSNPDETLSIGTIALTMAAVIVVGVAFTALLPSILTRDAVETAATVITTTSPQPPIEQFGAVQPAPAPAPLPAAAPLPAPAVLAPAPNATASAAKAAAAPAPLPAPALPAPAPNASASAAKTAPALRASVPPERPVVANATGGINMTAAEKAAVARGLAELQNTVAVNAPRPAPARPGLTAEEKAAVERGLRELEKEAGPAKQ